MGIRARSPPQSPGHLHAVCLPQATPLCLAPSWPLPLQLRSQRLVGKVANSCALQAARKSVRRPLTSRVTVHWIGCPVALSNATSLLWSQRGSWLLGLPVSSLNPGIAKTLRDPLLLSCLTDAEACVQSREETSVP